MQMDEGLDTGDMIDKVVVPLAEDETGGSLFDKLSQAGAQLCVKVFKRPGRRQGSERKTAGRKHHRLCFYDQQKNGRDQLERLCKIH